MIAERCNLNKLVADQTREEYWTDVTNKVAALGSLKIWDILARGGGGITILEISRMILKKPAKDGSWYTPIHFLIS